jgi:hypothetical protein
MPHYFQQLPEQGQRNAFTKDLMKIEVKFTWNICRPPHLIYQLKCLRLNTAVSFSSCATKVLSSVATFNKFGQMSSRLKHHVILSQLKNIFSIRLLGGTIVIHKMVFVHAMKELKSIMGIYRVVS